MLFYTSKSFCIEYPLEEANVVFLGIPSSEGSISSTSNYGPLIVRESLKLLEDYVKKKNVNIFEKIKLCDVGDIEVVPGSYELTRKRIIETINDIRNVNKNALIIAVGGNHLITLPLAEALKPKTILQLDAHADLRKDYLGNKFMQQTWARHASKFTNIVQIGVRSWSREELEFAKNNITSLEITDKLDSLKLETPIHLTIDIDVFDPSFIKTGLPEPNGLKPEEVFNLIERLPKIQSMDIVEISDNKLPSKTGFLAGKLILKILERWV